MLEQSPSTDVPDTLFDTFPPVRREDWETKIRQDLRGADSARTLTWESIEGVTLHAYYRADDLAALPHVDSVPLVHTTEGFPNSWRIRQDLTAGSLDDARRHARDALNGGVTDLGLHVTVDDGELQGIPLQQQKDLAAILADVDLTTVPIHLAAGRASLPLLAMLCNVAERRGTALADLQGSIDYDPLAALAGRRLFDADRAFDLAAEAVRFADDRTPDVRTATVDLRPYHEAGASAVQELGFALGNLSEQVVQLVERIGSPEQVASRLHLIVPLDTSYFPAIAKLRALRLLVPQVLAAYAVDLSPAEVFIQAVTSRRSETIYDPPANMLRGSTEAASGIVGGCDVLSVRPHTAGCDVPDDFALRMARNAQLILRHEAHLDDVADPGAGSYYLEVLTDELARAAWRLFQDVEREGGLLEALRAGMVQSRIAAVGREREDDVARGARVLVGTNRYPDPQEARRSDEASSPVPTPLAHSDHALTSDDAVSLTAVRDAAAAGATLGDLLDVVDTATAPAVDELPSGRLAEPFETLRLRTDRYAAKHGGPPRVFLLPIGDPAVRSARAHVARNVFGVAGFAVDEPLAFDSAEAGARAAVEAEADVVVLCSTDAAYPDLAPGVCRHLRAADANPLVIVVGDVPAHRDALEAAGVDAFIHRHSPLLETLEAIQHMLGINDAIHNPKSTIQNRNAS